MPELVGFDTLEKAFAGEKYLLDDDTPMRLSKRLESRRYPHSYRRSIPPAQVEIPSSDDETDSLLSDRSRSQRTASRNITPPHLSRENSGLPPTPPTMTNSDIIDRPRIGVVSPAPQFADAVRNALQSRKSGLSTPGLHLPTPDPSPPATSQDFRKLPSLQPPQLHTSASSLGAQSFQTARENMNPSQISLPQTPSPEPLRPSQQDWLNRTRDLRLRGVQLTVTSGSSTAPSRRRIYASSASESSDSDEHDHDLTPKRRVPSQRSKSPYSTVEPRRSTEKHISYGEGDFDKFDPFHDTTNDDKDEPSEQLNSDPASVEDVNNLIYQHIREENVKRHSTISDGSAMPVDVVLPPSPPRERKLKRTIKCESLRADASDDNDSQSNSVRMPLPLKYKKAQSSSRSLEASPIIERSRPVKQAPTSRFLSSTPSEMTKLTRNSMNGNPSGSPIASKISRQHTLRRSHKDDRLERSASIRNTSADSRRIMEDTSSQTSAPLKVAERALRHFSREAKLENNASVARTNLTSPPTSPPSQPSAVSPSAATRIPSHESKAADDTDMIRTSLQSASSLPRKQADTKPPGRTLRHFSPETKLENNTSVARTSLEKNEPNADSILLSPSLLPSSPRKSLRSADPRFLYPSTTPFSTSQMSDRTEVEVCEARGVNIYPHHNDSLLVIQHGSRPVSKDKPISPPHNFLKMTDSQLGLNQPLFAAYVEEPSPRLAPASVTTQIDSPLTNPRAAPEPPAIKFIPPTPIEELDRQLFADHDDSNAVQRYDVPQRRRSILQRARRYSESFVQPFFGRAVSIRQPRRTVDDNEQRPANLSPLWKPRNFWENFDSDEEDWDDYYEDDIPRDTLPRGGDTSHVQEAKRFLPRNMSVRMPGFRGNGGFLVGNSIGIDRHGSNNRRHYVSVGAVRKRTSEEMLRRMSGGGRTFTIPFSGGTRVQYVGVQGFRQRMSEIRAEREEKRRERRRQALRGQIQRAR